MKKAIIILSIMLSGCIKNECPCEIDFAIMKKIDELVQVKDRNEELKIWQEIYILEEKHEKR